MTVLCRSSVRCVLLSMGLLACCTCSRKPLVVTLPDANASPGEQNAQAINSAIAILRQLEGNPRGIEIQMQPTAQNQAGGKSF